MTEPTKHERWIVRMGFEVPAGEWDATEVADALSACMSQYMVFTKVTRCINIEIDQEGGSDW
jgi:hypothetical protein